MRKFFLLIFLLCCYVSSLQAKVEIVFWHSFAAQLGQELDHIVDLYNLSQSEYVIKPIYKGEYTDSLTSLAAAFRAKSQPAIIQVFEVGTALLLSPKGIIKPFAELMQEQGSPFLTDQIIPALAAFYSREGQLQALPFNTSVPIIFYNADVLRRFKIRANSFPKTWEELESLALKLKQAGFDCAYSPAYPAWIHIESFAALHGLALVNQQGEASYSTPEIIHHLERLLKWQKLGYLLYAGRTNEATVLFTSGKCLMFSQSSGSYKALKSLVKFKVGVAALPMEASAKASRHSNAIGGAALWAIAGQSDQIYRGIASFYRFLAQPKIQYLWLENTGYIPLSLSYPKMLTSKYPTFQIAKNDLEGKETLMSTSVNIPQSQLRIINNEALEAIFAGLKTPQQAMDEAVLRANLVIKRFKRNVDG